MPALNYATQYCRELASSFPYTLYFGALWNAVKPEVKFTDSDTVKIPKLKTTGRKNGNRDNITTFSRNFSNDWETKQLKTHRTWDTLIHPRDIDETNKAASIVNITKTMNENEKFPEMDAEAISSIYALKNEIEPISALAKGTINLSNVLTYFDALMDKMDEARVPANGRLLYVDTYTKTMIDTAKENNRNLGALDTAIARALGRIGEVEIIPVPTTAMKSAYIFHTGNETDGRNEGFDVAKDVYEVSKDTSVQSGKTYYSKSTSTYTKVESPTGNPSASSYYEKTVEGAKDVKMFLVHPLAVIPEIVYTFAQLDEPSSLSKGNWTYFEESFEDMFIYNERHSAIQFIVEK